MDQLREMKTFICVAQTENFSAAARQLGTSRSTVTKIISGLEQRLGIKLVVRSTHHVRITSAGELFAAEAELILSSVDRLHQALNEENAELKGEILVGAPPSFASMHLIRAMEVFRLRHPLVRFNLLADSGSLNLIREGVDLSIRIAPVLPDMALISRLLIRVPQVLVASPAYLRARGRPSRPGELESHVCLVHSIKSPSSTWLFDKGCAVAVAGAFRSDLGESLRQAAIQGVGISMHPTYMVEDDLREGRLELVLGEFALEEMSIHAVYPEKHLQPKRVSAFLIHLRDWLNKVPNWQVG